MIGRRQHVEHRERTNRRHFLEQMMVEHPRRRDRVIAGERSGQVGDALASSKAEFGGLEIDRVTAQLARRQLHRIAGPRARLFEIERNSASR